MKISVFGSCLSNLTASRLMHWHRWEQVHCVHHNRSDALVRHYIDKTSEIIPFDVLKPRLVDQDPPAKDSLDIILNQVPGTIGLFQLDKTRDGAPRDMWQELATEPVDAILIDNFMDVASMLVRNRSLKWGLPRTAPQFLKTGAYLIDRFLEQAAKVLGTRPLTWGRYKDAQLFLNHGFYLNRLELERDFPFTPFLTPEESARHQFRLYQHLRALQPKANIYFLCFQWDTSQDSPDRMDRARAFFPELMKLAAGSDLKVFEPVCAPEHLKIEGDWTHFHFDVYDALAKVIYDDMQPGNDAKPAFPYRLELG